MKTKFTVKERFIVGIFAFCAMSALFVYFTGLLVGDPLNVINILNPFKWFHYYLEYPIFFAIVIIVNIFIVVATSHQSHDHVLIGEDDARLATESEILEVFQSIDIKKANIRN